MILDPLYLIMIAPAMILAIWAQTRVHSAYSKASRMRTRSGMSGAEAAYRILQNFGLQHDVGIEMSQGMLSDHYDPRRKVLRLSPDVYQGRSLAAVGIAAHEVGHAIQDARQYAPLSIRNAIVPLAGFGSNSAFILFFVGLFFQLPILMQAAIFVFGAVVAFQLINLPVEFNASARAKALLPSLGIISEDERQPVARVLNAAAMTYVAATLTAVVTLLYFILRSR